MRQSFYQLLDDAANALSARFKPVAQNYRLIVLASYLLRAARNHRAVMLLARQSLAAEAVALVHEQIEMRLRSIVLCSSVGEYAVALLRWHDELRNRLTYLNLQHAERQSAAPQDVLCLTQDAAGQKLLHEWYTQKPLPQPEQQWVFNWQLWDVERLAFEVQKNLVESPRVRKELENLLAFLRDHPASLLLAGVKRFALIDDELNLVTLAKDTTERWSEGPVALATAATLDMAYDISAAFELHLEDTVETLRGAMTADLFAAI